MINNFCNQVKIQGSDQGNPEHTSECIVQVKVHRDQYLPQFEGDFQKTIDVNHPVNTTPVVVVKAVDRDRVVNIATIGYC